VFAQNNLPTCKGPVFSWSDCEGTEIFPGGDKYIGQFKSGRFSGRGIYYFLAPNQSEGNFFVGEFKDGMYNGLGIEYDRKGVVLNSGKWKNSQIEDQFAINPSLFGTLAEALPFYKVQQQLLLGAQQKERLTQDINGGSNSNKSQTSAASMWIPVFNLPRCEGPNQASWNDCIGVDFQQGMPYVGQFRNGSPYGQFEILDNAEMQMAQANTLQTQQITPLTRQDDQRLETEKLREAASIARQRQQELEEQLKQVQESRKKDQDRTLAEQKAKEQQRIAEEVRFKEQQRLALVATEISRLRAEAEESKRKQAELEEQLRLAKQQNQVIPPTAMTTMANRKALVIGNDSYKSVTKLLNAREDAKAIASNLTAVGYKVTLQLDLNEKEMKAALRTFSSQVQGGDEVMFFFAGHGVQLGATNYLLPTDIGSESEAQVKDEAIQLQRVLDDMTEKKAKFTLAMIDACRDNPFKSAGRNIGGRGLAPTTAATGQMVVFSAGSGQQALDRLGSTDKNKNGVFTRTFLKEMQKPGVSIDRIVKNVRNEVAELAKTIGHDQVPAIYDQVLGDFYFKK
jgi:hypothetical protein